MVRQYVDIFDKKLGNKIALRFRANTAVSPEWDFRFAPARHTVFTLCSNKQRENSNVKIYIYYNLPTGCGMIVAYFDGNYYWICASKC